MIAATHSQLFDGLRPAVFLDRDGVINANRADHVKGWDQFEFLPNVFEPLRRLAAAFPAVVVVSNQAAVDRGLVSANTVLAIHERMREEVARRGGRIDAGYYCPHESSVDCSCRKPRPGLLLTAARDHQIDLSRSFLIGDKVSDVEAALAAKCRPVLVLTGEGERHQPFLLCRGYGDTPVVPDLAAAVTHILERLT